MPTPATTHEASTWSELRAACERSARPAGDAALPVHRPRAAVLACSDARVSPARLFDVPAGELFVVRVAGNIATPEAVASLTYAVDVLGADTVVVLGHSHCGAVTAALDPRSDPALGCLVEPIRRALDLAPRCDDLPCAVTQNVAATVAALTADLGPLGAAIRSGRASLHGAVLDLATNTLTDIGPVPVPDQPTPIIQPTPTIPARSTTP